MLCFCGDTVWHLRTGDLAAAEAAGARIHMPRGAVNDGLDALDIGLPGAVGAPVRVADFDAESQILAAEFTFCHL